VTRPLLVSNTASQHHLSCISKEKGLQSSCYKHTALTACSSIGRSICGSGQAWPASLAASRVASNIIRPNITHHTKQHCLPITATARYTAVSGLCETLSLALGPCKERLQALRAIAGCIVGVYGSITAQAVLAKRTALASAIISSSKARCAVCRTSRKQERCVSHLRA
jgi:hypothetical protein